MHLASLPHLATLLQTKWSVRWCLLQIYFMYSCLILSFQRFWTKLWDFTTRTMRLDPLLGRFARIPLKLIEIQKSLAQEGMKPERPFVKVRTSSEENSIRIINLKEFKFLKDCRILRGIMRVDPPTSPDLQLMNDSFPIFLVAITDWFSFIQRIWEKTDSSAKKINNIDRNWLPGRNAPAVTPLSRPS